MTKKEIYKRIIYLFSAMQYCTAKKWQLLSAGERIMINQEIAQLLYRFDYPSTNHKPISDKIESKLEGIKTNFQLADEVPYGIEKP